MEFKPKIEKVPFPSDKDRSGRPEGWLTATLRTIKPGESFHVPREVMYIADLRSRAYKFAKANGITLSCVTDGDGSRVFRRW